MSQKTRFFGLYSTANGPISITATYLAEATEFSEITQNNGYYNAVQGHSRSSISVPIEKPHVTSCMWIVVTCTSYNVLFQRYGPIFGVGKRGAYI